VYICRYVTMMQKYKMQKKAKTKSESKYPNSKRGTSHPTHPSTSQRWSDLGVWLGYRLAGFWTQHGLDQWHPSHIGLSGSEISHLCVWSLSGDTGSFQHLWHWCCHKTKALSQKRTTHNLSKSEHPNNLWATASGSNILGFSCGKGYTGLLMQRPRNQRGTKELTGARSRLAFQSTPIKIGVWVTTKLKRRSSWIEQAKIGGIC